MTVADAGVSEGTGRSKAEPWPVRDLRRVAAAACAGLVAGFFVNGIGGRLAMLLLARLNPDATGRLSDDGFTIGRFTLGATAGLVLFVTAAGVLGGLIYLIVRELRAGPGWFQTLALTIGPGVVIGAVLVHTEGIDFTILQPVELAIALFVAIPAVFAYVVGRLAERWLAPRSWFLTGSRWRLLALVPVVLSIPAYPLLLAGVVGRTLYWLVPPLQTAGAARGMRLLGRVGLAAVFAVALVDLVRDLSVLV